MTKERMQEIHKLAMESFGNYKKWMTSREIDEAQNEWDKNPSGHSSFASTFRQMMESNS